MRISDWSSDVCSSDLKLYAVIGQARFAQRPRSGCQAGGGEFPIIETVPRPVLSDRRDFDLSFLFRCLLANSEQKPAAPRSEEHTSELQSLMRISYAVFCLKKKTHDINSPIYNTTHHLTN